MTDSLGFVPNIFFSSLAKLIVQDEFGVQYIERDPVGSITSGSGSLLWSESVTYSLNDLVKGSNSKYYTSLISNNVSNDPTVSLVQWSEVRFTGMWNTNETYSIGDVVQSANGDLWKAITATAGNDPTTDSGTNWLPAINGSKLVEITALENLNSWGIPETSDFTGATNESRQIDASSNTVDILIPALVAGDSFIYHNMITSTFKVQILNPTQTIKGQIGDFSAGTNIEIEPGQSVQMVAVSSTILSITGVLL